MSWWDENDKYLWQAMGKEHLDGYNEQTDEVWMLFIEQYSRVFADLASELAQELWCDFLNDREDE